MGRTHLTCIGLSESNSNVTESSEAHTGLAHFTFHTSGWLCTSSCDCTLNMPLLVKIPSLGVAPMNPSQIINNCTGPRSRSVAIVTRKPELHGEFTGVKFCCRKLIPQAIVRVGLCDIR